MHRSLGEAPENRSSETDIGSTEFRSAVPALTEFQLKALAYQMLVLGLDLETTGVSWSEDTIIEVGAVLWDTTRSIPLEIYSTLVKPDSPETLISADIERLTGISTADIAQHGIDLREAKNRILGMAEACGHIVAHFGLLFDRLILERFMGAQEKRRFSKLWIDTGYDLAYPESISTRKLDYLAFEHELSVPFKHRAVFDALTTLRIFSKYPLEEILNRARSPLLRISGRLGYEDRGLAASSGFFWNRDERLWQKVERAVVSEQTRYPFEYSVEELYRPPPTL